MTKLKGMTKSASLESESKLNAASAASGPAPVPAPVSWIHQIKWAYQQKTKTLTKLIDAYLLWAFSSGLLVFLYGLLTWATPYVSFLGAFFACVGSFVFAVNLRIQTEWSDLNEKGRFSPERALAQFLICHLFLFFVTANLIA